MLKKIWPDIEKMGYCLYEIAVMDENGLQWKRVQPSNLCQDSYSVTKAFTMTAAGMLFDQGKLDVNEKILPIMQQEGYREAAPGWEKVTVDHVLTHKMGLSEGFLDIDVEDAGAYDTLDYMQMVLRHSLPLEPGTKWQYSDAAYYLMSRIVAARAGKTCDMVLADMMYRMMRFREAAWSRCPLGHPLGATGLYVAARGMVKLGWLYANRGVYGGERVLSEAWVDLALGRYEFAHVGHGIYGKGGMNGQMLLFSPEKKISVAWHGFEESGMPKMMEYLVEKMK